MATRRPVPRITGAHIIRRSMPAPTRLKTVAAVVAATAVGGCGGEDDEVASPTVTTDAAAGIEVTGGEYFFDPESIVVEGGGGPLEVTLDNEGSLAHNLRLFEGETDVGGTPTFAGGEARSAEVDLEPGTYRMVCTVADHEALGMVGELEVR